MRETKAESKTMTDNTTQNIPNDELVTSLRASREGKSQKKTYADASSMMDNLWPDSGNMPNTETMKTLEEDVSSYPAMTLSSFKERYSNLENSPQPILSRDKR